MDSSHNLAIQKAEADPGEGLRGVQPPPLSSIFFVTLFDSS